MSNTLKKGCRAPSSRAVYWLIATLLALTLAGCGGGGETAAVAQPSVSPLDQRPIDNPAVKALFAGGEKVSLLAASTVTVLAIETLFDSVAEVQYSGFFPPHQATLVHPSFHYRYYPATGTYVGVATVDVNGLVPNGVYVMGGVFGGAPVYIAMMYDFIAAPPAPTVWKLYDASGFAYPFSVNTVTGVRTPVANKTSHQSAYAVYGVYDCGYAPQRAANGTWPMQCTDALTKVFFQAYLDPTDDSLHDQSIGSQLPTDTKWVYLGKGPHHPYWGVETPTDSGIYFGNVGYNVVTNVPGDDGRTIWYQDGATGAISRVAIWGNDLWVQGGGILHWLLAIPVTTSGNT